MRLEGIKIISIYLSINYFMKFTILLFSAFIFSQTVKAQTIEKTQNQQVFAILTQIDSYRYIELDKYFIKSFKISNEPGSADSGNTGEVSYSLIIVVAEYDEYPEFNFFKIGPFISPNINFQKNSNNSLLIEIESGILLNRVKTSYEVSSDLTIIEN